MKNTLYGIEHLHKHDGWYPVTARQTLEGAAQTVEQTRANNPGEEFRVVRYRRAENEIAITRFAAFLRTNFSPTVVGKTWNEVHAGSVLFHCNGWWMSVFNDCDSFDYFNYICGPYEEYITWDDFQPECVDDDHYAFDSPDKNFIRNYQPEDMSKWKNAPQVNLP